MMNTNTEIRLQKKLEKFEKSRHYLSPRMSLALLSTLLKTNGKYLSYIINNHRSKHFNSYINGLRIQYILMKLEDEPQYRKYKIAALSKECGFSSPAKFATVFKKITLYSPSDFIENLSRN